MLGWGSAGRWGRERGQMGLGAGELSLGRPSRGQIGPLCRRVFGMPRQPRGKATHLPAGFRRWEKPAPRGAPALWEDLSTRGRSRGFPPARGRVLSSGAGAWDPGEGKRVTRRPRSGLCDFPQSQMAEIRTLRLTLLVAPDTNPVSPQAHAVLSPPHALPAPKTASQTSHLSHPTRPLRRKPPISARCAPAPPRTHALHPPPRPTRHL